MEPVLENPQATPGAASSCSSMARVALGLSIFAFIPPLGIAAIVLGHGAERRIAASAGALNGKGLARAALWIAYLQLVLVSVAGVMVWNVLHDTAEGFRRDAMVQRFFRENDQSRTLDAQSAWEAEVTAKQLMEQLVAIEEESRHYRDDGMYTCHVTQLLELGLKGATDAENRALAARVEQSPYLFEIGECDTGVKESSLEKSSFEKNPGKPGYVLTAMPRAPRMPPHSRIFCVDQSGVVLALHAGISTDCIIKGEPAR
jgi:hypothetical protein